VREVLASPWAARASSDSHNSSNLKHLQHLVVLELSKSLAASDNPQAHLAEVSLDSRKLSQTKDSTIQLELASSVKALAEPGACLEDSQPLEAREVSE